jgi:hypothetical protein
MAGDWSTQFYRAIRSDDAEMLQVSVREREREREREGV